MPWKDFTAAFISTSSIFSHNVIFFGPSSASKRSHLTSSHISHMELFLHANVSQVLIQNIIVFVFCLSFKATVSIRTKVGSNLSCKRKNKNGLDFFAQSHPLSCFVLRIPVTVILCKYGGTAQKCIKFTFWLASFLEHVIPNNNAYLRAEMQVNEVVLYTIVTILFIITRLIKVVTDYGVITNFYVG